MAFTTTRGESGVDFIGTDGVDALFVINEPENNVVSGGTGVITIDAKAGNDNVDLTNESGVTGNAEVKLGEGDDILTMGGNAPTRLNRLVDSFVNGGPGNDDITTEGSVSTKLRGNEGDDDFFLNSNYTGTTINGNAGQDSVTLDGDITLSNTKILGGSGNDGQLDFSDTNFEILAVDSVIQGGKGLDTITIGDVTAGTTNFRVSGGADNDTINVANSNALATGVAYNGAAGADEINFTAANTADAITKGGDDDDRFSINGTGDIDALGETGNDNFVIEAAATGDNTVTGGAGSDTYNIIGGDSTTFVFNSVSESSAATSGTTVTFDVFETPVDNNLFDDVIDLSSGGTGEALVGNRLNDDEVNFQYPGDGETLSITGSDRDDFVITNATAYRAELQLIIDEAGATASAVAEATALRDALDALQLTTGQGDSFASVKAALDGTLTASDSNVGGNTGRISAQFIDVTGAGDVAGYYAILNNTNTIIDSGDMMFAMSATDDNEAYDELAEIAAAIEAGF